MEQANTCTRSRSFYYSIQARKQAENGTKRGKVGKYTNHTQKSPQNANNKPTRAKRGNAGKYTKEKLIDRFEAPIK